MPVVSKWSRPPFALAALYLAIAAAAPSPSLAAPEMVVVALDQAKVMKVPDGVATLVVGNPLIADISLQAGGMMVITGKGYGATNLLALDRGGTVLSEMTVQVQGPRDNVVVVYKGVERESYSCTPKCEQRITLGDSPNYFGAVMGQIGGRAGQAQGGVQSSK